MKDELFRFLVYGAMGIGIAQIVRPEPDFLQRLVATGCVVGAVVFVGWRAVR